MRRLGRIGIWSGGLREADPVEGAEAAAELEELGYSAIWLRGGPPEGLEERLRSMLRASRELVLATGIASIWLHPAEETAAMTARLRRDFPGRFVLGLGVSHAPMVEQYRRPLSSMREYLDRLDAAAEPVPRDERILAALAPRMLELARERTLGSHTYLVTPEHTRRAREALGPDALLVAEQTVVLAADRETARRSADAFLDRYFGLPNYVDNLVRIGFDREEAVGGGSDRLFDALVAWGDVDVVRRRVEDHLAAGADQVALQPVSPHNELPREAWRRLAAIA